MVITGLIFLGDFSGFFRGGVGDFSGIWEIYKIGKKVMFLPKLYFWFWELRGNFVGTSWELRGNFVGKLYLIINNLSPFLTSRWELRGKNFFFRGKKYGVGWGLEYEKFNKHKGF